MNEVRTSVLDRLTGNTPSEEYTISNYSLYDTIIQNVRNDLQNLLNTRKAPISRMVETTGLKSTLLNYGMEDFTYFNPESKSDHERLQKIIEHLINTFEPRLRKVKVKLLESSDKTDFRVRFHIEAVLCIEEIVIPVQFNSIMDPSPPTFTVKEVNYE